MRDEVLRHFEHHLGKWKDRFEYRSTEPDRPSVWVYEWDRPDYGMSSYATVGYSETPTRGGNPPREYFFPAKRGDFESAAQALLLACAAPLSDDLPLRAGHTVGPLPNPIHGKTRVLLLPPWEEESFRTIDVAAAHVEVMMLVLLYEKEFRFLRAHDHDVFWDAIDEQGVDVIDIRRRPMKTPTV
jgi:hypothetical protein